MVRCIIFITLIYSSLFCDDYFLRVIDKIEVSKDFENYKEAKYITYVDEKIKKVSIRITLNKKQMKSQLFYLNVVSDMESLVNTNAIYSRNKNAIHIKLDDINNNVLYFNYVYDEPKKAEFRCDVINEFEYLYLYPYEGILYGLAYGILFCAFLYYTIIYFSTKIKAFLYYSIMQFFVLLSLVGFVYVSFLSYPNQNFSLSQMFIDIFETSGFLFTLLFAKEILQTKKIMPKMNLILNFFVLLNIIDIIAIFIYKYSILYEYMRFDIGFLLPTIAGLVAIYKGDKFALVYTFGWFTMFIFINIAEDQIIPISGIYTVHLAAPMESLIFSFALGIMLKNLVTEQNEKEKFLIHKSKLASMGEMINNIAHQWKQPLTNLGYINMNLQLASKDAVFDRVYFNQKLEESNQQIDFMSNTIDNFKDFYKPAKDKTKFYVSKSIQKSIDIMKPLLQINDIRINFEIEKDCVRTSYENEYSQVVLNILSNAIDELIQREVKNPTINIKTSCVKNKSITTIVDNAGGIKVEKIEKIFEPYFTTKDSGTGIGLYMSKIIINSHFKGELQVKNILNGACFSIVI